MELACQAHVPMAVHLPELGAGRGALGQGRGWPALRAPAKCSNPHVHMLNRPNRSNCRLLEDIYLTCELDLNPANVGAVLDLLHASADDFNEVWAGCGRVVWAGCVEGVWV